MSDRWRIADQVAGRLGKERVSLLEASSLDCRGSRVVFLQECGRTQSKVSGEQ